MITNVNGFCDKNFCFVNSFSYTSVCMVVVVILADSEISSLVGVLRPTLLAMRRSTMCHKSCALLACRITRPVSWQTAFETLASGLQSGYFGVTVLALLVSAFAT